MLVGLPGLSELPDPSPYPQQVAQGQLCVPAGTALTQLEPWGGAGM